MKNAMHSMAFFIAFAYNKRYNMLDTWLA